MEARRKMVTRRLFSERVVSSVLLQNSSCTLQYKTVYKISIGRLMPKQRERCRAQTMYNSAQNLSCKSDQTTRRDRSPFPLRRSDAPTLVELPFSPLPSGKLCADHAVEHRRTPCQLTGFPRVQPYSTVPKAPRQAFARLRKPKKCMLPFSHPLCTPSPTGSDPKFFTLCVLGAFAVVLLSSAGLHTSHLRTKYWA